MSHFVIKPMTAVDAQALLYWQYSGDYAIYSMSTEYAAADVHFFVDPRNRYYAIDRINDSLGRGLGGFCCFGHDAQVPGGDYSEAALDIGLGMRPDLTGQGLGTLFLGTILDFARQTFAPQLFRATIASFNGRSRRVFAKQGFEERARFMSGHTQPHEFVIVIRPA